jgi:hypothetical protein
MRDGCPCALLASMRPIRSDIHEAALKRHRDGSPAWVWLLGARNGVHAAGRRHASCAPARRDGRPCSDLSHELAFGARSGHPADGVGGRRGFVWPRPAVSARSDYETLRLRCEFGAVLLAEFRSNALKRGLTRDRTPEALTRSHTPSLQPSTSNRSRRPRMTRPHPFPRNCRTFITATRPNQTANTQTAPKSGCPLAKNQTASTAAGERGDRGANGSQPPSHLTRCTRSRQRCRASDLF